LDCFSALEDRVGLSRVTVGVELFSKLYYTYTQHSSVPSCIITLPFQNKIILSKERANLTAIKHSPREQK
jgi:hypothetical protein